MMKISSLIQTLTQILTDHGDFVITTTNEITGEVRFINGIDINENLEEINFTHLSLGDAIAEEIEEDLLEAEFFEDGAWAEDGFVPSAELILLLMENPKLLDFPELLESLSEELGY